MASRNTVFEWAKTSVDTLQCHKSDDNNDGTSAGVWETIKVSLKGNVLMIVTLVAVVIGFGVGFGIRPLHLSADTLIWIGRLSMAIPMPCNAFFYYIVHNYVAMIDFGQNSYY